jgi:hypothetical protein
MRKYFLAFLGLALLLSACRIESNINLDINEDGSATVAAEVGFDEEMLDLVGQGGGDPGDILGDLPDLGGQDTQPIQRVEGDMSYFGVQTTIADLSTFDFDGLDGQTFSEFSYEFDDSSATLSAKVDSSGLGDLGGDDLPIDPSEITGDIFSAQVVVAMPGTVTVHNADEVRSDGTLVWNLPLSGTKDILATSDFGSSPANWIWFVVGGVLIVGIIAAVGAVMMSKRNSEQAVVAAAVEHTQSEESASSTEPAQEPEPDSDAFTDDDVSEGEAEEISSADSSDGEDDSDRSDEKGDED